MEGMSEVFAKHKTAILLGGAGLGVLILISSSGKSSGNSASSNLSASLQSQQIAAAQSVAISKTNAAASVQNNAYAAAAWGKSVDAATATDAAHQQADVGALATIFSFAANRDKVNAAVAVNANNNQTSYETTLASILGSIQISAGNNSAAQAINSSNNNAAVSINAVNAQTSWMKTFAGLTTAENINTGDNNTRLSINQTNTNAALETLKQSLGFEGANLPSLLQHSENLASIGSNTEINLANIGANRDKQIAQINADASTNNALVRGGAGLLGGSNGSDIIGGLLSIFGI